VKKKMGLAKIQEAVTTSGLILYETTSQRAGTRGRRGLLTTVRPTPPIPARAEKEKNL
jgi:hypothetical protein